jgi:hypothetical protein
MAIADRGNICERELAIRAQLVWQAIQRCCGAYGVELSDSLHGDLSAALRGAISQQSSALLPLISVHAQAGGAFDRAREATASRLMAKRDTLISHFENEARFFVQAIRTRSTPERPSGGPSITVHGNVGALQTGDFATATVYELDLSRRQELIDALRQLEARLAGSGMSAEAQEQAADIVQDAITASAAPKPNAAKLTALLRATRATVEFVANLGEAWSAVADAAGAIGIPL